MKFVNEVIFYFSLVIINIRGSDARVRLILLKYSSKKVMLYWKYKKLVIEEIKRVKTHLEPLFYSMQQTA